MTEIGAIPTIDETRKLLESANYALQIDRLRDVLQGVIANEIKGALLDVRAGAPPKIVQQQGSERALATMLRMCSAEGWQALSIPVMDKYTAEQVRNAALCALINVAPVGPEVSGIAIKQALPHPDPNLRPRHTRPMTEEEMLLNGEGIVRSLSWELSP